MSDSSLLALTERDALVVVVADGGRATPTAFHRLRLEGTLVVGSDGLFNYVDPASIAAACDGPVIDAADRLVGLPRLASGVYRRRGRRGCARVACAR